MKVFTTTGFKGHYPVGTAAVVVAESKEKAAALLNVELKRKGLPDTVKSTDMRQLRQDRISVNILCDGNY